MTTKIDRNTEHNIRMAAILKRAAAGAEQDTPFEQAFSNLAHAYLRDKAPGLMNYEIGFQLVDKVPDDNKAIGLFGFKVGDKWLFAPVFFLNGNLKGHELLYIKDQDMFVPMQENWLNYIMNRKPNVLGKEVSRSARELGVLAPDLTALHRSPSKYGSAMAKWATQFIPVMCYLDTVDPVKDPKFASCPTLPSFLKDAGIGVIRTFAKACSAYPRLAAAVDKLYGLDKLLSDVAEHCEKTGMGADCYKPRITKTRVRQYSPDATISLEELEKDATVKKGSVQVWTTSDATSPIGATLAEEDRDKILYDGYLVKDSREDTETTEVYEDEILKLANPTESGLCDVLLQPGKLKKCLVLMNPRRPNAEDPHKSMAVLVDVDGKEWINVHPSRLWIGEKYAGDTFNTWWNGLADCNDLDVTRYSKDYIVLSKPRKGDDSTVVGTLPFSVWRQFGTEDADSKQYEVSFHTYTGGGLGRAEYDTDRDWSRPPYHCYEGPSQLVLSNKVGTVLRVDHNSLYVPPDSKLLTFDKSGDVMGSSSRPKAVGEEEEIPKKSPLMPSSVADLQLLLRSRASLIKVSYYNGNYIIGQSPTMSSKEAILHLVKVHGLREDSAKTVVKDAAHKRRANYYFKYASPYPWQQYVAAPPFPDVPYGSDSVMGSQLQAQYPYSDNLTVDDISSNNTDQNIYNPNTPDPRAMQSAVDAAGSGQKEVFDTSVIGSLLKSVRDDSMVDKHLGDLMKAMDRIGRILFMLYWRRDQFEERYGKTDLPALEDSMKNTFESLGDLILSMKEREIGEYDHLLKPDLSAASNDNMEQ